MPTFSKMRNVWGEVAEIKDVVEGKPDDKMSTRVKECEEAEWSAQLD